MILTPIPRVNAISPAGFKTEFLRPGLPVIISGLANKWPAFTRWTWDYFKSLVGSVRVGVYNNIRAGARVPVNGADDYMLFGDYLDLLRQGPVALRIFLFNILNYAPGIVRDFTFPDEYTRPFLKRYPMLFAGGAGSIAHMHYDIDLSHIFHTQFLGRKQVLILNNDQSELIYRMPFTVESAASFVRWYEHDQSATFPALQYAQAWHAVLEHGDTLFMPSGYWHHMEYLDSGFALSLRALPAGLLPKLNGLYHILGKRGINNSLIKLFPNWWYQFKRKAAHQRAENAVRHFLNGAGQAHTSF